MRKHKTLKIDDNEITVKELRVDQILEIWESVGAGNDLDTFKGYIEKHMGKVTDVTLDDLRKMAPSEIKQIFEAFKEVNQDFFDLAQTLGLGKILEKLKNAILTDLSALFAGLLEQAMSELGNTDTPSS